jgi:hypothetical protein
MKSQVTKRILAEMAADPWHKKLKRWFRLKRWIIMCRTRFIWDREYEHWLFKGKIRLGDK